MTPAGAPTVFVIDDDANVRAAIEGMLKSVGLRSQSFGTAQEFLRSKPPDGPSCLVLDVRLPGVNGLDFQRRVGRRGCSDSHNLHHGPWRYSHDREGHEIRRRGVLDQALPGSGLAGCDSSSFGSRPASARAAG